MFASPTSSLNVTFQFSMFMEQEIQTALSVHGAIISELLCWIATVITCNALKVLIKLLFDKFTEMQIL